MTLPQTLQQFAEHPNHLHKNIRWRLFVNTISEKNHIFVFGAPRSGTTLMKLILGAHSRLSGPGYETGIFMYKNIFQFQFDGFSTAELDQIRRDSQDIVQFFDTFAERSLQKNPGDVFIEKTPPHVLQLNFLKKHFPNARFINIVRDGRDCFCSARRHPNVVQGSHVERYAKYWRRCIQSRLKHDQPNIFDVRYEDLVNDPETQVRAVMAFLQEEYEPNQIDPAYYSQNKIAQTGKQHFSKLAQPINNSSQKRWTTEISAQEIEQFQAIAGSELQTLGYALA